MATKSFSGNDGKTVQQRKEQKQANDQLAVFLKRREHRAHMQTVRVAQRNGF